MKAVLSATNMLNNVEQCNRKLFQVRFLQMRKILAIIGALITGGIGIAVLSTAQQASASPMN
jgi:hypothetical protein